MKKIKMSLAHMQDKLTKIEQSRILAGSTSEGGCAGCLCNADISGNMASNSSGASSKASTY